jgi:hypothetical protein
VIDAFTSCERQELNMDFFIGYNWPLPAATSRVLRRVGGGLAIGAVGLAGALAAGHRPLEGGNFEFGHVSEHHGAVIAHPVPMLHRDDGRRPWPLLVAPGKHGADDLVRGLDRQDVAVQATRISRGDWEMLEMRSVNAGLKPRRHRATDREKGVEAGLQPRGQITLTGEIVDSKCFLGVMVPGEGVTHRGCAALCLRGGIPAALHVKQKNGPSSLYLIAGSVATRDSAIAWAGEVVEMTGMVTQLGGWQVLTTEPGAWRRLER